MVPYISDKPAPGTSLASIDNPNKIPRDHEDTSIVPLARLTNGLPELPQLKLRGSINVSGLSFWHKRATVKLFQQAAVLALHNRRALHYTQGGSRWEGILHHRKAWRGEFPHEADCSAVATWALWNGLDHYHVRDVVNGQHWRGGFTGTMLEHGHAVASPIPGDLIIYEGHVAPYTGGGLVVSNGSEGGPYLLPWRYRKDIVSIRRYI